MPHAFFFSRVAAGYQSDGGGKTKRQRKKLKKRAPFGYSETNYVSYDLSNLMGNHHSIEDVPCPTRPPRPCTTDLPDLPGLPIYKTFASEFKPATTLDDEPPPPFPEEQLSESATAWVLAQPETTPIQSLDRSTQSPVPSTSRHEAEIDSHPVPHKPPQYDRASRLAESYQSLLPDFDSLEYPEAHSALGRQNSDQRLRGSNREQWHHKHNPRRSHRFSPPPQVHTLRHTSPRPGTASGPAAASWQPASAFDMAGYPPRAGTRGLGGSADTHSILTDSSATAVESDVSPVDSRFSTGSETLFPLQGGRQQAFLNASDGWDLNTTAKLGDVRNRTVTTTVSNEKLNSSHPFSFLDNAGSSASDKETTGDEDLKAKREHRPGGRITSSDYVGLQICSELLTDELLKTFFRRHPNEKHAKASKLQMLLLIEAYEAMLDNCRKELLNVPLPARSAGVGHSEHEKEKERENERKRAQRRRHIRDAVRILDHWLDSLYVIYDDTFGDLPSDGEEEDQGEHGDHKEVSCETSKFQDVVKKDSIVQGSGWNDVSETNLKHIGALPVAAQVPVQPAASTTGPSRLFRGWNRGVGF